MLYPFLFFFFALRSHSHWGHSGSALSVFDDSEKFCERFAWLNALFEYMTHKGHNDCPWRLTKITWMPSELEEFRRVFWEEKNLNFVGAIVVSIYGLEPRRPAHLNEFNFHFQQHLWSLLFKLYFTLKIGEFPLKKLFVIFFFFKKRIIKYRYFKKMEINFVGVLLKDFCLLIILPIIIVWI